MHVDTSLCSVAGDGAAGVLNTYRSDTSMPGTGTQVL